MKYLLIFFIILFSINLQAQLFLDDFDYANTANLILTNGDATDDSTSVTITLESVIKTQGTGAMQLDINYTGTIWHAAKITNYDLPVFNWMNISNMQLYLKGDFRNLMYYLRDLQEATYYLTIDSINIADSTEETLRLAEGINQTTTNIDLTITGQSYWINNK